MPAATTFRNLLRLAELPHGQSHSFLLKPSGDETAAIAGLLGVTGLRKLRLKGWIGQVGVHDWRLEAELGATVTQDCVVTLEPVVTRIDEPVLRRYVANPTGSPQAGQAEMHEDDSVEPLRAELDIGAILIEELALALPIYPRVPGTGPFEFRYAPGSAGQRDETTTNATKPFAELANLVKPVDESR